MNSFNLYEDILSRTWNRYYYEVEAETLEEAIEKVKDGEVADLIRDSIKLSYLEAGGVDNWTWYDEALTEYNEDDLDDDTLTNEYKDA